MGGDNGGHQVRYLRVPGCPWALHRGPQCLEDTTAKIAWGLMSASSRQKLLVLEADFTVSPFLAHLQWRRPWFHKHFGWLFSTIVLPKKKGSSRQHPLDKCNYFNVSATINWTKFIDTFSTRAECLMNIMPSNGNFSLGSPPPLLLGCRAWSGW